METIIHQSDQTMAMYGCMFAGQTRERELGCTGCSVTNDR